MGKAVVQHLRGDVEALAARVRAQHHGDQAHAAALGGGGDAVAGLVGGAGLAAVAAVVEADELVGVGQLGDAAVAVVHLVQPDGGKVEVGRIGEHGHGHHCHVARRGLLALGGQTGAVDKIRICQAQFAGALVHAFDKDALRAVKGLRDGHGGVVGAAYDGALEQHGEGLDLAHVQKHLRTAHARRRLRDGKFVLQRNAALRKGLQRQQNGHHLGDGGHGAGRVGVLFKDHLPALRLDEDGRGTGKPDGRRFQKWRGAQRGRRGGRRRGRGGGKVQFRVSRGGREQHERQRQAEQLAQLHGHPS